MSPGSKTLGYAEAVEHWLGIAGDLSRKGIRKFVMLNAHGGNSPLMTVVATEARVALRHAGRRHELDALRDCPRA